MEGDITKCIHEAHENGKIPRGTKSYFITLIPKKMDPMDISNFRPISLVGVIYKIIAKILSNRLKKILPEVINHTQSAFLKGRNILHSALIANELVDEVKRRKGKLDFCSKWIGWMKECLRSNQVSILVNGSATTEFQIQKGLRQRDPLAPFLYVVAAEGLAGLMRSVVQQNMFTGYKVGGRQVEVNILQYADDTIFVGEVTQGNVLTIKCILRCLEPVSSLKVNFHKSNFGGIGVENVEFLRHALVLNYRIMTVPFKYHGIPIGDNPRKESMWMPLLDKFNKKLAPWKHRSLSMVGIICLINSVLTELPLYFISIFKMSKKVIQKVVAIQRNFLWGGEEGI
uniref:Transposon TX1 uncharacterized n=1 Tax=Cajanus cajan TaxID=3821 RepID=A0A151RDR1_CAJCA|nr:Transposon TX1 uncharacterized [Cajanus cajan]